MVLLEPVAGDDRDLVNELTELVNDVYADAERGLWREEARRTTAAEFASLIRARQIAIATHRGEIAGCIRIHDVSSDTSEFGLLASAPRHRGTGAGRALLEFAERHSRERGLRAIRLELLVPSTGSHPNKEFLRAWYGRRGYRHLRTGSFDGPYPHLSPLLAVSCDLEIYEKLLQHGDG